MLSKKYIGLNVKYMLFLCDFNDTSLFLKDIRGIFELKLITFCPVGAGLLHAYGRTDGQPDRWKNQHDEPNSRFSQILLMRLKTTANFLFFFFWQDILQIGNTEFYSQCVEYFSFSFWFP